MKKTTIAALVAAALMMNGCAKLDAPYNEAKDAYLTAKPIVKVVPKEEATAETLTIIDTIATWYDELRTAVRGEEDEKKSDATTVSLPTTSASK